MLRTVCLYSYRWTEVSGNIGAGAVDIIVIRNYSLVFFFAAKLLMKKCVDLALIVLTSHS